MSHFFDDCPEFVEEDLRKDRPVNRVTIESLSNKHSAFIPDVTGLTVLDLGSCLGATGHYCLAKGAAHYVGVEVQPELANKSREILGKHWGEDRFQIVQQDIRSYLSNAPKFDVVIMFGVIYAFADTYGILKLAAEASQRYLLIESMYPRELADTNASVIQILQYQTINSTIDDHAFAGTGARPSPTALKMLLKTLGFSSEEGLLYPVPAKDTIQCAYTTNLHRPGSNTPPLPSRFMLRFSRSPHTSSLLEDVVATANVKKLVSYPEPLPRWKFDAEVASRYEEEAANHIPDYERVIDLSVAIVDRIMPKDVKIVDVGSAKGYTMQKFRDSGFANIYGIESSPEMSAGMENVFNSDTFVGNGWNVVVMNWTLHFVHNKEAYLQAIFDGMEEDGILVLTDKMEHSDTMEVLYHQLKLDNGVDPEYIQLKKNSLNGVMTIRPLPWYYKALDEIGFSNIEVVNSRFMFNTILARKR